MKRKTGLVLILLGLSLILGSVAWAGNNIRTESLARESSQAALTQLIRQIPEQIRTTEPEQVLTLEAPPTAEVVYPDYVLDPGMEMPVQTIDGNQYIGALSIPAVELELPIIDQWSYEGASVAPCRYSGSAYLDDLVIAAHNHRAHFGVLLNSVRPDDEVIFTDVDGNVFQYRVVDFEVIQPAQIEEMTTGDWDLTLFTCNPGMQTRMAVRCEKYE